MEFIFRQLLVAYYVTPPLTRGWVCNLQLLLGLASAVFSGLSNVGLMAMHTVSILRLSERGGPGPCIYFLQEQGSQLIPPGTG
jgi:hypothetical protein